MLHSSFYISDALSNPKHIVLALYVVHKRRRTFCIYRHMYTYLTCVDMHACVFHLRTCMHTVYTLKHACLLHVCTCIHPFFMLGNTCIRFLCWNVHTYVFMLGHTTMSFLCRGMYAGRSCIDTSLHQRKLSSIC